MKTARPRQPFGDAIAEQLNHFHRWLWPREYWLFDASTRLDDEEMKCLDSFLYDRRISRQEDSTKPFRTIIDINNWDYNHEPWQATRWGQEYLRNQHLHHPTRTASWFRVLAVIALLAANVAILALILGAVGTPTGVIVLACMVLVYFFMMKVVGYGERMDRINGTLGTVDINRRRYWRDSLRRSRFHDSGSRHG